MPYKPRNGGVSLTQVDLLLGGSMVMVAAGEAIYSLHAIGRICYVLNRLC